MEAISRTKRLLPQKRKNHKIREPLVLKGSLEIICDSSIKLRWVFSKKQAEAISKLTTADVNAALRKYIKPDEITFVLAGDQKKAAQKKQD